jgi:hypothetical protein
MSNGRVNPYVPRVHLNNDGSVDLVVQIVGFQPGNWAEISGYIAQGPGAFAPFAAIKEVPAPEQGVDFSSLNVTLPPVPGLMLDEDVTVITRVAEVLIWPTALEQGNAEAGFKATWVARSDNSGSAASRASVQGGSQSEEVWATPGVAGQLTGPMPRTGLTAAAGDSEVTLSWNTPTWDGDAAVIGYNIYQGTSPGKQSRSPVRGSPFSGTSHTVRGLTNGTTYFYTIAAVASW